MSRVCPAWPAADAGCHLPVLGSLRQMTLPSLESFFHPSFTNISEAFKILSKEVCSCVFSGTQTDAADPAVGVAWASVMLLLARCLPALTASPRHPAPLHSTFLSVLGFWSLGVETCEAGIAASVGDRHISCDSLNSLINWFSETVSGISHWQFCINGKGLFSFLLFLNPA